MPDTPDVGEIRARREAIVDAPWVIGNHSGEVRGAYDDGIQRPWVADTDDAENATFIAHAPTDIDYLLAKIDGAIAALKAPLDTTKVLDNHAGRALWKANQADTSLAILEGLVALPVPKTSQIKIAYVTLDGSISKAYVDENTGVGTDKYTDEDVEVEWPMARQVSRDAAERGDGTDASALAVPMMPTVEHGYTEVDIDALLTPAAKCNRCGRSTWSESGQKDRMLQPDGSPCGGTFIPIEGVE